MEEKSFRSWDRTRLTYYVIGPDEAPVLVLSNGLGGTVWAWRRVIDYFSDRYRIITWDYRGIFKSDPPEDPSSLTVPAQCRDLLALLDREGVEKAVFLGWSMGVQFNFELYRNHGDRFLGMVALNGTAGRPFDSAFFTRRARCLLPPLLGLLKSSHRAVSLALRHMPPVALLRPVMRGLGLFGPTMDMEIVETMVKEFATLDVPVFMETLRLLAEHDAWDVPELVEVPTLIVCGTRDLFTPPSVARRMARKIAGAELMIVPGATHYIPAECSELLNLRLEKFLITRLDL